MAYAVGFGTPGQKSMETEKPLEISADTEYVQLNLWHLLPDPALMCTLITWGNCQNAESDPVGLEWFSRIIYNKLSRDANVGGPQATLGVVRL